MRAGRGRSAKRLVDSQEGDLNSVPQWSGNTRITPEGRVRPSWSARDEEGIEFAEVEDELISSIYIESEQRH